MTNDTKKTAGPWLFMGAAACFAVSSAALFTAHRYLAAAGFAGVLILNLLLARRAERIRSGRVQA